MVSEGAPVSADGTVADVLPGTRNLDRGDRREPVRRRHRRAARVSRRTERPMSAVLPTDSERPGPAGLRSVGRIPDARRQRARGARRVVLDRTRRDVRRRRRIGIRQEHARVRRDGLPELNAQVSSGRIDYQGEDLLAMPRGALGRIAWRADRDGLSGSDELAQPVDHRGRAGRRGDHVAPSRYRAKVARDRTLELFCGSQHAGAGRDLPPLSASVERRPAAARADRDGAREQSRSADHGRADDRDSTSRPKRRSST